jgi:uncharacterized MAPEG superfamily protein
MTIIAGSVIFAALMLIITKMPMAIAMKNMSGAYDNKQPRLQAAKLEGFGKRAMSAHENSIEAFPLFAAGVLMALYAQASVAMIENLCLAFVAARIAYVVCYWLDWDKVRSLVWGVGFVSSLWLMCLALP